MSAGKKFPAVSGLEYIKGEARVEELRGSGRAFVVEGWATWCGPCRTAIPHMSRMAAENPLVPFIGVSSEARSAAEPFVAEMGDEMAYTVAVDTDGSANNAFAALGMKGIPFAVVVDASGAVTYAGHPMQPEFAAALADVSSAAQLAAAKEAKLAAVHGKSRDELAACKVKELKGALAALGVSAAGCVEKGDLVALLADELGLE